MPIPLRPLDPPAMPARRRRRERKHEDRSGAAYAAAQPASRPAGPIRAVHMEAPRLAAAGLPGEDDGWPCLPYTER